MCISVDGFKFNMLESVESEISGVKGKIIARLETYGEGNSYKVQPSLNKDSEFLNAVWTVEGELSAK